MVKRFGIWLEDRLAQRQLTSSLLRNLGYKKDALDHGQDVILSNRDYENIEDAISKLPIGDDNKEEMLAFARSNQQSLSLKALASKIDADDIEKQDTLNSKPAVLPQANTPAPKPMNPQQQMMQNQPPSAAGPTGY